MTSSTTFEQPDQFWPASLFTPATEPDRWQPPVVRHSDRGIFSAAAWCELLYAVLDLAPAITFFVLTVTLMSVGVGLAVIYVGLPLIAIALLIARAGGHLQRLLAAVLLQLPVPGPAPIRRGKPGPLGALGSVLTDPGCWRAVSYHCLKILLTPITFSFAIGFYATGLGGLSYGLWQRYLPTETASDGTLHRGLQWWPDYFVDTWQRMLLPAGVGVLFLLIAPRVVRFFISIDRVLIATLLSGPVLGDTPAAQR